MGFKIRNPLHSSLRLQAVSMRLQDVVRVVSSISEGIGVHDGRLYHAYPVPHPFVPSVPVVRNSRKTVHI